MATGDDEQDVKAAWNAGLQRLRMGKELSLRCAKNDANIIHKAALQMLEEGKKRLCIQLGHVPLYNNIMEQLVERGWVVDDVTSDGRGLLKIRFGGFAGLKFDTTGYGEQDCYKLTV